MPTLIATVWTDTKPSIPWVWKCSECATAFDLGPILRPSPTQDQIAHINLEFEAHCKQEHPHLFPVVPLDLPVTIQDPEFQA